MKLIDLNGKVIEVENLTLALMQADDYRHYQHSTPGFEEADKRLQAYWADVYQKLLQLKVENDKNRTPMKPTTLCDRLNKISAFIQFTVIDGGEMLEADYFGDELTLSYFDSTDRPSSPAYRLAITHHSGARAVFYFQPGRKGLKRLQLTIALYLRTRPFTILYHCRGAYQLLDPNGMDHIGEYVTLKDAQQTSGHNFRR